MAVLCVLSGCISTEGQRSCRDSRWEGRKVAFLGDSITTARQKNKIYWQYLEEMMGIKPVVCAVSGYRWRHMPAMAQKLKETSGDDVDAILILTGTNDYMGGVPPGEWWTVTNEVARYKCGDLKMPRRYPSFDPETVRGRINETMKFLKSNWPDAQIVLMTPVHRAYFHVGENNYQPPESFPNPNGVYLEEYVRIIREAADIWSVPLIDLYRESGLMPTEQSYAKCFRDLGGNDFLHPNSEGHRRMAELIRLRLAELPLYRER